MKTIDVNFPGCQCVGGIIESDDPFDLSQDMADVVLPNGVRISVGWSPEGDPQGCYLVTTSLGLDDVGPPLTTRSAPEAYQFVSELVAACQTGVISPSRTPAIPPAGRVAEERLGPLQLPGDAPRDMRAAGPALPDADQSAW